MARRHSLRASDSDREEVAERLRVAAGEGRLDVGELEQRLDVAFHARTYGELDRLVVDLPMTVVPFEVRRRPGLPVLRRPGLPVLAGATLAFGLLLTVFVAAATTGFMRLHSAVEQANGRPQTFDHGGPIALLGTIAPLIVIVFLVAICAALGWLFSQGPDGPHAAPNS